MGVVRLVQQRRRRRTGREVRAAAQAAVDAVGAVADVRRHVGAAVQSAQVLRAHRPTHRRPICQSKAFHRFVIIVHIVIIIRDSIDCY